jgi:hypothetical protein
MVASPAHASDKLGRLDLKGRVFVVSELRENESTLVDENGRIREEHHTSLDVDLDSARIGVDYQTPLPWLSGEVTAEFAGKAQVKDGYARADFRYFRVQAGQFKMPTSAVDQDSAWELPTVGRGMIHDLMFDWLDVAGRRPGIVLSLRGKKPCRPRLTVGAFQGSVVSDLMAGQRDTSLIDGLGLDSQSLVARGQVRLGPVTVGAFYQDRVGSPDIFESEHFWTGGGDLKLDYEYGFGALRLWADFTVGESWYEHSGKAEDDELATFLAARVIGASRFGGTKEAELYVEPFFSVGLFDPDSDVTDDGVFEVANGINAGFWDLARISLQGQASLFGRNFPQTYYLGQLPTSLRALLLLGVLF